jgi:GNAT superfamily N-acetyltransferase
MAVTVTPVQGKADLKKFIRLPWMIYRGNKVWVPPLMVDVKNMLDRKKNPFYEHSETEEFLARKDGKVVGRICAIWNNNHNQFHDEKCGMWGFFECINDQEVANALFDAAKAWLKDKGADNFRGPFNLTINDTLGLLLDAYELPPVVMCTYNPPYYVDLVQKYGFVKAKDVLAWYRDDTTPVPERVSALVEKLAKRAGFTIRNVNIKDWDNEVERVRQLYNKCWENNWGAVPMTEHEFMHTAKDLKMIIDPEMAFVAEVNGEAVGFQLNIPDANELTKVANGRLFPFGLIAILVKSWFHKFRTLRVMLTGILPEYRNRGIEMAFVHRIFMVGTRKGYKVADQSWQLEDNRLINATMEHMESYPYKRWRIYEMLVE